MATKGHIQRFNKKQMLKVIFTMTARTYMSLRECAVTDRTQEISEQAVCDLNTCLDKLNARCEELEYKIQACTDAAVKCATQAKKEPVAANKKRTMDRARQHLIDRRSMTAELDRASHAANMIKRQVSTIVNSHMDSTIIGAMRQYAEAANRLGLSDKASEVQALGDELADCMDDANKLQEALGGMSNVGLQGPFSAENEAADLQAELDAFFADETTTTRKPEAEPLDDDEQLPQLPQAIAMSTTTKKPELPQLITKKTGAETVGLRQRTSIVGEVLLPPPVEDTVVPTVAMMI